MTQERKFVWTMIGTFVGAGVLWYFAKELIFLALVGGAGYWYLTRKK